MVCQVGFETLMDTTDRALPWVNLGPKTSPFVPPPPPSSVFMGKKIPTCAAQLSQDGGATVVPKSQPHRGVKPHQLPATAMTL